MKVVTQKYRVISGGIPTVVCGDHFKVNLFGRLTIYQDGRKVYAAEPGKWESVLELEAVGTLA